MICKRCNHEIPNEAKICGYCGAQIVPEGVVYNGLGEDAYMPPTQKELSDMKQQNSPVPPQQTENQQSPQMTPPQMNYQQPPQTPPAPSNPLLSPEYHPGGDASPQFANGFGYSQMPYNDIPVKGDGGADGMAIASLVLGSISLVICCCSVWISMIAALIGLVLGIIGIIRSETNKGIAIGGVVCSALGLILGIMTLLMGLSVLSI